MWRSSIFRFFLAIIVGAIFFIPPLHSAEALCDQPYVLIVLDRSGSMRGTGGNSKSKWTLAKEAIQKITNNYKGKLTFGLITFNSRAYVNYGIDRCKRDGVSRYCVSNLQRELNRQRASGGTSLIDAIKVGRSHYESVIKKYNIVKAHKKSIMFLTDGVATCADEKVEALFKDLNVKTYVIGFGSGVDAFCLDKMAIRGQTARQNTKHKYYQANNKSELDQAMKAIADASMAEECNNLDDDCDGRVDEGLRKACKTQCGSGYSTCSRGKWGPCSSGLPVPERCNGKDDDCDGLPDENWPQKGQGCALGQGACRATGIFVCNKSQTGIVCNAKPTSPKKEICNDKDDDCDGAIDENWLNKGGSCFAGIGACRRSGTYICNSAQNGVVCSAKAGKPKAESCNGQDDDCDGKIDENLRRPCKTACGKGTETCQYGFWVNCTARQPSPELCNGKDDDCDGKVDEDWPNRNKACIVGKGICQRKGVWRCRKDQLDVECSVRPGKPTKELCNGKDDDCDGFIDENWPQKGEDCVGGIGACQQKGKKVCSKDGKTLICSAKNVSPKPEICDGIDNDCNGKIDEKWPKKGRFCSVGKGECQKYGSWICSADKLNIVCSAKPGKPEPEKCDGKDNNCNGVIDENLTKKCKTACGTATQQCRGGHWTPCPVRQPSPEKCDGIDNDCDGKIDEDWPKRGKNCEVGKGECKRFGRYICDASGKSIRCSATPGSPRTEICDNRDNDCDGKIDEDWAKKGQKCSSSSGGCKAMGTFVCKPDGSGVQCSVSSTKPEPEKCDNLDNDCNGKIDDGLTRGCSTKCEKGVETCIAGKWTACSARKPKPETCNGLDDNCDGTVDENLTRECSTKCGKGKETCVNGKWEFCDAPKPEKEVCDGKDNDCDGKIDELPPKSCRGACGKGTASCVNGKWTGCSGPQPEPEKCDGKDNDCNGKIDDNLKKSCRSACGSGESVCINGHWTDCSAPKPQPEICDGKDNDCDGDVDNKAVCPPNTICKDGKCRTPCRGGECRKGFVCVEGFCIGDPCKNVTCPQGQRCMDGHCTDLCKLVTCPQDTICSNGQCVKNDCYIKGCPDGEICYHGYCKEDPCKDKKCAKNEFCRDGQCLPSCANVQCADDQKCVDGKCVKDPTKSDDCANVFCKKGEFCQAGKCVADPCYNVQCPKGRSCQNGRCEHDPCLSVHCPEGQTCLEGQCFDSHSIPQPDGNENSDGGSSSYPDGWTYSPDEGTVTLPDGRVVPAEKITQLADGRIVIGGGDDDSSNFPDDNSTMTEKLAGQQFDNAPAFEHRQTVGGCLCNASSQPPFLPLLVLPFFILFLSFRRKS